MKKIGSLINTSTIQCGSQIVLIKDAVGNNWLGAFDAFEIDGHVWGLAKCV